MNSSSDNGIQDSDIRRQLPTQAFLFQLIDHSETRTANDWRQTISRKPIIVGHSLKCVAVSLG
jgi:hypothetical protein